MLDTATKTRLEGEIIVSIIVSKPTEELIGNNIAQNVTNLTIDEKIAIPPEKGKNY